MFSLKGTAKHSTNAPKRTSSDGGQKVKVWGSPFNQKGLRLPFAFYLFTFTFPPSSVLQQNRVYFRFCSAGSPERCWLSRLIFRLYRAKRREPKQARASYYLSRVCHNPGSPSMETARASVQDFS
jgi:hypothetical protein